MKRLLLLPVLITGLACMACSDTASTPTQSDGLTPLFDHKGKPHGKPGDDEPEPELEFVITTTDLGTLEGSSSARATSVVSGPDGNSVRVVGTSGDGSFYWTLGSGMVELAVSFDPYPERSSEPSDLNDAGSIAGEKFVDRGDLELNGLQAIFWNSSMDPAIDLLDPDDPYPPRSSFATAINNNALVVGQSFDHPDDLDAPHAHAMLWAVDVDGITVTQRDLHEETFSEFKNSIAEGINDADQVVGQAYDGIHERAFLWDNGNVKFLDDDVDPSFHSFASAINNANPVQIVGVAHDQTGGSRRVLLWTVLADGTVLTDTLPTLAGFEFSSPTDLNDDGEVVGTSNPSNNLQDPHATLWTFAPNTTDRTTVDLGIGWATSIDNSAVGLTRVVGGTNTSEGKGRRRTRNNHAILWEVAPVP
jgi:uncharacterized membrane protein